MAVKTHTLVLLLRFDNNQNQSTQRYSSDKMDEGTVFLMGVCVPTEHPKIQARQQRRERLFKELFHSTDPTGAKEELAQAILPQRYDYDALFRQIGVQLAHAIRRYNEMDCKFLSGLPNWAVDPENPTRLVVPPFLQDNLKHQMSKSSPSPPDQVFHLPWEPFKEMSKEGNLQSHLKVHEAANVKPNSDNFYERFALVVGDMGTCGVSHITRMLNSWLDVATDGMNESSHPDDGYDQDSSLAEGEMKTEIPHSEASESPPIRGFRNQLQVCVRLFSPINTHPTTL